MDFREVTGRLVELGVTLRELAAAMGVSYPALVQARMDSSASGYRNPPAGWRNAALRIAEEREGAFRELAAELRREA